MTNPSTDIDYNADTVVAEAREALGRLMQTGPAAEMRQEEINQATTNIPAAVSDACLSSDTATRQFMAAELMSRAGDFKAMAAACLLGRSEEVFAGLAQQQQR